MSDANGARGNEAARGQRQTVARGSHRQHLKLPFTKAVVRRFLRTWKSSSRCRKTLREDMFFCSRQAIPPTTI